MCGRFTLCIDDEPERDLGDEEYQLIASVEQEHAHERYNYECNSFKCLLKFERENQLMWTWKASLIRVWPLHLYVKATSTFNRINLIFFFSLTFSCVCVYALLFTDERDGNKNRFYSEWKIFSTVNRSTTTVHQYLLHVHSTCNIFASLKAVNVFRLYINTRSYYDWPIAVSLCFLC